MIRTLKPKSARSKRILKEKEPKVIENVKSAIFIKTTKSSQLTLDAMRDMAALKKPWAVTLNKKNDLAPFEDEGSLDFLSQKNDASLFCMSTHSKKRPHTLTFGRFFDHHLLDMIELSIQQYKSFKEFHTSGCGIGQKPLFVFSGALFATSETHQLIQSLFLDFFKGELLDKVALNGLEHVISLTATTDQLIQFRVYQVQFKKSASAIPRVELVDMGPHFDFKIGRSKMHDNQVWREAMRQPKQLQKKKVKNIKTNDLGETTGRIHLGRQNLDDLQTRKMKGLKRKHFDLEEEKPVDAAQEK